MSLAIQDNLRRSGPSVTDVDIISCHSPIVMIVMLGNSSSSQSSGDVTLEITGQSPADDTDTYTFDMGYQYTNLIAASTYEHYFRLDITDIIREICNEPNLSNEVTSGNFFTPSRLATEIKITAKSSGESDDYVQPNFMHGFNQVNDPYSSCLVEFGDEQEQAIIPIVAGAPMLFYLWHPITNASVDLDMLVYKGSVLKNNIYTIAAAVTKSLYQFYEPVELNQLIYDESTPVPELWYIRTYDQYAGTGYSRLYLINFKIACEGDVVLAWLNRYGVYSYMAFDRFSTVTGSQSEIGSYDIQVDDLANVQSRTKSRGYENAKDVISAVAKGIPTEYFSAIEDLFYSMDVYYFTGTLPKYTFASTEWVRVKVKGSIIDKKKYAHGTVSVDITLPEKYTQIR